MSSLPKAHVFFPSLGGVSKRVLSFEVIRQPYSFDAVRATIMSFTPVNDPGIQPGSPVVLQWNSGGVEPLKIHGYVHTVRSRIENLRRVSDITITGIQSSLSWEAYSEERPPMRAHEMAAYIFDYYSLDLLATPTKEVAPTTLDQKNNWQYLCDMAREIGYLILCVGSTTFFVPIVAFLQRSYLRQSQAATFRNTMTAGANLLSFDKKSTSVSPAVSDNHSRPASLTSTYWKGSRAEILFRKLFKQSATARMISPGAIYPFDTYEVRLATDTTATWTVTQVKYVLTQEDYYAEIDFGGDGLLYRNSPTALGSGLDAELMRQYLEPSSPVLTTVKPVFVGEDGISAYWRSPVLDSPGTKGKQWLAHL